MPHGVIRDLGDFELSIDLGYEVQASISISIVGLESAVGVTDDGSIIGGAEETDGQSDPGFTAEETREGKADV
jgi:hypothetical protein